MPVRDATLLSLEVPARMRMTRLPQWGFASNHANMVIGPSTASPDLLVDTTTHGSGTACMHEQHRSA